MSLIYDIHVLDNLGDSASIGFSFKLNSEESFDSFKDKIFNSMPEPKNQSLDIYYQGKCGHLETILASFPNRFDLQ